MGPGPKTANYPTLAAMILKQMFECVKLWLVVEKLQIHSNLPFYCHSLMLNAARSTSEIQLLPLDLRFLKPRLHLGLGSW